MITKTAVSHTELIVSRNEWFLAIIPLSLSLFSCGYDGPEYTEITARVTEPTIAVETGEHELGLGELQLVNRKAEWKDGFYYIPGAASGNEPLPLLIWLHGGGGNAESTRYMFPFAEEYGVVILTLDARHNTWDGIDSPYTRDVPFINEALKHLFQRVAIDPERIALGGLSDGAAYALAVGRANGDFFSHLVAVAPGWLEPPSPLLGQPRILIGHGVRDRVYPSSLSRRSIVPRLRSEGYEVSYFEFDGPHWVTEPAVRTILSWLSSGEQ